MGATARDLALGAAALGVRLLYLWQSGDDPTALVPVVDAGSYHEIAARWAGGGGVTRDLFWQSPFYPAFLAAVYALAGASATAARLAQAVVGAGTAVLAGRLGERVHGRAAGWLAGLATALYGPLVFYDGELVGAGWAAFWGAALLLLLPTDGRAASRARLFGWGAAAAAACLTRAEFLPFVAVATAWLALRRVVGPDGSGGPARAALAAAGALAVLLPFGALSLHAAGRLVLLPAAGGLNLHLGNNARRCETLAIRPGWAWERLIQEPAGAGAGEAFDAGAYFASRVLLYAVEEPAGFVAGLGAKGLDLAASPEIPRNDDPYLHRRWSPLLAALVWRRGNVGFPFALLFPLSLAGAALCARRAPWTVGFVLIYGAAIVVAFPAARYRVPLVPALAALAAGGCLALRAAVAGREWRRLGTGAGAIAAGLLITAVPGNSCPDPPGLEAELHALAGMGLLAAGDAAGGERHLARALELSPDNVEALNALANLRLAAGRPGEALELLGRAEATGRGLEVTLNNAGNILAGQGRAREALARYAAAIRGNPRYPLAHTNLGVLLSRSGRPEAEYFLREALRLSPGYAAARVNLGSFLARQGRLAEAEESFAAALRDEPGNAAARANLAEARRLLAAPDAGGRAPR